MADKPSFLPSLAQSFKGLNTETEIVTRDFATACEAILPIFDHLGTVFGFARTELAEKKDSLIRVQDKLVTLDALVEADKKAGKVTTKNSCARNLYRLLAGISFISQLLQNLAKNRQTPLRQAAAEAYDATLSAMHGYMVRMAIKTSMYMLPTRDAFLASINETEDSAKAHAADLAPSVDQIVKRVTTLYGGTSMPMSDAKHGEQNRTLRCKAAPKSCRDQAKSKQQQQDPFETRERYEDSALDKAAIWLVSRKIKEELGDAVREKDLAPGYDGFVELSNEVMKGRSSDEQRQVIWKILRSLLPQQASARFRRWFPLSQWSAEMNARITKAGFAWLVGDMEIRDLEVDFKGRRETWKSGVHIKKCRYLEVSGCKAMCVNMCKRPTQEFFAREFGLPLTMVPDFEDLSCEMRFGEEPPPFEQDDVYKEPCFSRVCGLAEGDAPKPCPKMDTARRS